MSGILNDHRAHAQISHTFKRKIPAVCVVLGGNIVSSVGGKLVKSAIHYGQRNGLSKGL